MVYSRILLSHKASYVTYVYILFFKTVSYKLVSWMSGSTSSPSGTSRATSWGCTAGSFFHIKLYISYMFYTLFFKTVSYKLVSRMSESARSPSMTIKQLKLTLADGWRYILKLKGWSDQFTSNSYYYCTKTLWIGTNQKLVITGRNLSNCLTPNHLNRLQKTSV